MMFFRASFVSLVACAITHSLVNANDSVVDVISAPNISMIIDQKVRMLTEEAVFDAFIEALYTLATFAAAACMGGVLKRQFSRPPPLAPAPPSSRKNARSTTVSPVTLRGATIVSSEASPASGRGAEASPKVDPRRSSSTSCCANHCASQVDHTQWDAHMETSPHVGKQLLSNMRSLASRHCFREALQAYDSISDKVGKGCGNTWSLLLYCSVEAGDLRRCEEFFNRLSSFQVPSNHDFVNMVRYCVCCADSERLLRLLKRLRCQNAGAIDILARNKALAVCMSGQAFDLAELLVMELPQLPLDVVGYNTLMKGYMQACRYPRCFDLYVEMQGQGITGSEMTFGIMLDAGVGSRNHAFLKQVFLDLQHADVELNVVHYTTFIKGLVGAGCISDAMWVLEEMNSKLDVKPDLVTYTTLVKGHADTGDVIGALDVLEQMLSNGIAPDVIVYNVFLTGCSVKSTDPEQVLEVVHVIVHLGFQPSITTRSILVKMFAKSQSWGELLAILETSPQRLGIWPEPRIYAQLAQACASCGDGRRALEVYAAMVRCAARRGVAVDRAANTRIFRLCSSCDEGVAASIIFEAASSAGGKADIEVINRLMLAM